MESDIVERLREATMSRLEMGWPAPHVVQRKEPLWLEAADEIERLRAELAAAIKQRDEAQREACVSEARYREERAYPLDIPREEWIQRDARSIAAERGWDCFAQEGGGA
jgi:hypothetical protein